MIKFEDFDLDLRENKVKKSKLEDSFTNYCDTIVLTSLNCGNPLSKIACGPTGNCNITKISKCTGR